MAGTDKRIIKTKKGIKAAFHELLKKDSFEHITVTDICNESTTSRITFYNYYEDKYALVEEIFDEYVQEALDDYHALQKENNSELKDLQGYNNMLTAIINLCENHFDFFSAAKSDINPYLYSSFYNKVFDQAVTYINHHSSMMKPKYPIKQTVALLCNGLWGVISETIDGKASSDVYADIFALYNDILNSDLFIKNTEKRHN